MQDFTITLVQATLHWQEPAANRSMLGTMLESALDSARLTDLIVLPEMFTTGFTMDVTHAEPTEGPTLAWMRHQAAQHSAVVTGSVLVADDGHFHNRLLWVRPDGSFSHYDKRHLFRLAGEHEVFAPGSTQLVEEWCGWRIMPLICYDLRFPVWSRNPVAEPYDLLVYVANWPQVRVDAWSTLLRARAIENVAYVAGVNRLGEDGKHQAYSGQSALLNMQGSYLAQAGDMQTVLTRTLQAEPLLEFRRRMPFLLDSDEFELREKQEAYKEA